MIDGGPLTIETKTQTYKTPATEQKGNDLK